MTFLCWANSWVLRQLQGLTSYYFALVMKSIGITDHNEQFEINGSKTIVSLIVGLIAAAVVDKVGRRPLFMTATFGRTSCSAPPPQQVEADALGRHVRVLRPLDGMFRTL